MDTLLVTLGRLVTILGKILVTIEAAEMLADAVVRLDLAIDVVVAGISGGFTILDTLSNFGLPCLPARSRGSLFVVAGAGSNVTMWPLASKPNIGLLVSGSGWELGTVVSMLE